MLRTNGLLAVLLGALLTLLVWPPAAAPQAGVVSFQDVTTAVGVNAVAIDPADPKVSGDWGYIAVADYDLDGWDDLLISTHPGVKLYRNNGNGTFSLQPSPLPPPIPNVTDHRHVFLWCDVNGDGYDDLIVGTGFEGASRVNLWMRNNRNGTFTDVAGSLGVQDPGSDEWALTCADIDRNGRLDVLMARRTVTGVTDAPVERLWMNYGGSFKDEAKARGFTNLTRAKRPYGLELSDLNGDGYPDGAGTGNNYNTWFLARGDGTYSLTTGVYVPIADLSPYLHDSAYADFNGDGLIDAVIVDTFTSKDVGDNAVLRVHCNTGFFSASPPNGLQTCWKTPNFFTYDPRSLAVGDFDNDGSPDLFLTLGGDPAVAKGRDQLWLNNGSGKFTEAGGPAGLAGSGFAGAGGTAVIDYDMDGRLDLVVGYNMLYYPGPFKVYRNASNTGNRWVGFVLRGAPAIGARVEITACSRQFVQRVTARTGWLAQDTRNVHFGLGTCAGPVAYTVQWPNGQQTKASVSAGAYHVIDAAGPPGPAPTPGPTPKPAPSATPTSGPTPTPGPTPGPTPTPGPAPTSTPAPTPAPPPAPRPTPTGGH